MIRDSQTLARSGPWLEHGYDLVSMARLAGKSASQAALEMLFPGAAQVDPEAMAKHGSATRVAIDRGVEHRIHTGVPTNPFIKNIQNRIQKSKQN